MAPYFPCYGQGRGNGIVAETLMTGEAQINVLSNNIFKTELFQKKIFFFNLCFTFKLN